jgi:dimethyladenosine transferase 1
MAYCRYFRDMSHRRGAWAFGRVPLTLTFQMEVAVRICGQIDSKTRSRLSIVSQYLTEPKLLFSIPGSCFVPKPQVDVGVVGFVPRIEPLISACFEVVEKVARQTFIYRNKHVLKCVKTLYPKEMADELAHEMLRNCGIDPTTTSGRLGIEEFADMCQIYEKQCHSHPGLFLYDHQRPDHTLETLKDLPNATPPKFIYLRNILEEGVSLKDFRDQTERHMR